MSNQYQTQGYTVNDAGRRLIVDPITRIEGHMRCEVNIDEQNVITNAVSCGTMFRGLEIILQGRDPRDAWAFVERICGVCTGVHALASVYAIEDAIGIQVPDNANIIRNIMLATLWCHDHLVHFYQLAGMDWIDVLNALKADPRATSQLAQSLSACLLYTSAILKPSTSSARSSKSIPYLAVRTPILTGSLAGCRARSISIKAARSGLSIWSASTWCSRSSPAPPTSLTT